MLHLSIQNYLYFKAMFSSLVFTGFFPILQ